MAAIVNVGGVQFGGSSNQVGLFNGQNMQNAWNANSGNISNYGTAMGQMSVQYAWVAVMNNWMPVAEPVIDSDFKNNGTPMLEGP